MDPNTSQPQRPQPGQIANGQPFTPPRPQPEWQQGLGGVPTQQPGQPVPQQPGPQLPPRNGELPTPTPVMPGQPQPQPWTPPTPPRQPVSDVTPPRPSMGSDMPSDGGGRRRLFGIIAVVLIVLLLIASLLYWLSSRKDDGSPGGNTNAQGIDLATLQNVTLFPPDAIDGYKIRQTGIANIKNYVANDNSCELIVGTTSAAQLPGTDLNTILQPQVEQLKKVGATVTGPSNGSTLTLADVDDDQKTYSLPTVKYSFSQDKKHVVVHYSAVILKNGDRVVVNRSCFNQNGEVDNNKINDLNEKTKAIKVMEQPN